MTLATRRHDFSSLFDRAAAACAESQRLVNDSARTVAKARASRGALARTRRCVMEMRDVWASAEVMHSVLRDEVERVARLMRDSGVDDQTALATVRTRVRFVLYDGGLTEQDAEPVVERVSLWVEQVYGAV